MGGTIRSARTRRVKGLALAAVLAAAGCSVSVPAPRGPDVGAGAAELAWGDVLTRFVDDRGRIDFRALAVDPSSLERYVAHLAVEDPQSAPAAFPSPSDALAYYLNAYNALA